MKGKIYTKNGLEFIIIDIIDNDVYFHEKNYFNTKIMPIDDFKKEYTKKGGDITIEDYKEVLEDKKRLTKEIDIILNGKNAAENPSLCDVLKSVEELKNKIDLIYAGDFAHLFNLLVRINSEKLNKVLNHMGYNKF